MFKHLFLFIVLASGLLSFFNGRSQINTSNITIIRDSFGVPHIFAPTDAEVAYGLAWAHAEDDFPSIFQLMLVGKHRLGELNGPEGAKQDYFAQYIEASERTEKSYNDLPLAYRKLIEGYAQGLSAYAKAHPNEVLLDDVFPITGIDLEKVYTTVICGISGGGLALGAMIEGKNYESAVSVGSNGMAVSSKLSADGNTYLVNDPHWLIDGNITFYEVHLSSEEGLNISGGVYPGMPIPVNGITPTHGWNLPFNFPDLIDIYELEINPDNSLQYRFDDQWLDLKVRKIPLKVKVGPFKLNIKRTAYSTVYGPAMKNKDGKIMATRFAANQHIGGLNQLYDMARAKDFDEFKSAVKKGKMPLFNVIYADRDDNIYYAYKALIPKRNPNYNWQSVLPGNTSETLWTEFIDFEELPQVTNPECGYVYNMNSSPYFSSCPEENPLPGTYHESGGMYIDPENDRSERFRELIEGKQAISFQELKDMKYDLNYPEKDGAFKKTLYLMQLLDPNKHPSIADAIGQLRITQLNGYPDNQHTALFLLALGYMFEAEDVNKRTFVRFGFPFDEKMYASAIKKAKRSLLKGHGSISVPLDRVQMLVRGEKMVAIPGIPQNLNSVEGYPTNDGLIEVYRNSSFLQFAQFTPEGVEIESVIAYGNSNRPDSSHYDDQMEMHAAFQTKEVEMEKSKLLESAIRVYSPGR